MPQAPDPGKRRDEAGFAIIVALWAVAVIGLVGLGYVAAARARVTAAAATGEHARLHLLAEAAVTRAVADVVDEGRRGSIAVSKRPVDGTPVACAIAPDVAAVVTVEDEGGKVNLNAAPNDLLRSLFLFAGASPDAAARLTGQVAAARERAAAAAGTAAPGVSRQRRGERRLITQTFQSVFEFQDLSGDAGGLMGAVLPYVTIHSSRPGLDPSVAPMALLAAIGQRGAAPATRTGRPLPERASWQVRPDWSAPSERQNFLVRAAVVSPRARSSVEALVAVAPLPQPPFRVLEWRRDRARPGDADLPAAADLPPC